MAQQDKQVIVMQQPNARASQPVLRRELELFTMQSQQIADRFMDRVAYSLFSLELILQIIGEREDVDEVEALISTKMGDLQDAATGEIERLKMLMKKCGLGSDDAPEYTRPQVRQIFITAPLVMHFTKLLKQLDFIVAYLDTLWMNGEIDNRHHVNAAREWQSRVHKLAQYIINIEGNARRKAYRAGKAEQVDKVAPKQEFDEADTDTEAEENSEGVSDSKVAPPPSTAKKSKAAPSPATKDDAVKETETAAPDAAANA
ncbi:MULTISPECIES: hypothetical protein [Halomonas]|uniref:hypothetical protein n=1 Tax=Halomonas TaxID=2745 RepID=UPI003CF162AE